MKALKILRVVIALFILGLFIVILLSPIEVTQFLKGLALIFVEVAYEVAQISRLLGVILYLIILPIPMILYTLVVDFVFTCRSLKSIKMGKGKILLSFSFLFNSLYALSIISIIWLYNISSLQKEMLVPGFLLFIVFFLLTIYALCGIALSIYNKKTKVKQDLKLYKKTNVSALTSIFAFVSIIYYFIWMMVFFFYSAYIEISNFASESSNIQSSMVFLAIFIFFLVQMIIIRESLTQARKGKGVILFIEMTIVNVIFIYFVSFRYVSIFAFNPLIYSVMGIFDSIKINKQLKDNEAKEPPKAVEIKEKPANPAAYNYW